MKIVLSGVGDTFYGTALITISLSKNLYIFEKGVFSVACSVGFASCKTLGKQPKHPCFGRSPNAGRQSLVSLHRATTVCD